MKKVHMSREQLVAEAIDLVTEDVTRRAFDGEILPDLLSLIPTEKLIEFLPADEEDEEIALDISKIAALMHWAKMFRSGAVDDEHGEFIADILARVITGTDSVPNQGERR